MNEKTIDHLLSRRFFVRKRNILESLFFPSILTEKSISSSNQNCCGREEKKVELQATTKAKKLPKTKDSIISIPTELIIEVPKQTKIPQVVSNEKLPLFYEVISNTWPISHERVENLIISRKRCYFSNEAISIKPITAVPGIGKKYGQLLADHGFIYARQLLGYYMMLKDNEMFRKWLEYKFHIPRFRAAEKDKYIPKIRKYCDHSNSILVTSALNELIRRTL